MNEKEALGYALRLLNRRDYSSFEMGEKLRGKGVDRELAVRVVRKLEEKKLIDDQRFCENYVFFRLKKGYGKNRIFHELKGKGIGEELAREYLKGIDEMEIAKVVFFKRLGALKGKKNCRKRLYDFMVRRGFDFDVINELLLEYGQECV